MAIGLKGIFGPQELLHLHVWTSLVVSDISSPGRHVDAAPQTSQAGFPNHVPSSSSSSVAAQSIPGRDVREVRDARERDVHPHAESSRRVTDTSTSVSTNPLSRLGKAYHSDSSSHYTATSSSSHLTDHNMHSQPQTHPSSSSSSTSFPAQPLSSTTTSMAGGAHPCPTSSSDGNLTTHQALQTLQQALLMAKGKNSSSAGGGDQSSYSASAAANQPTPSMSHATALRHSSNGTNASLVSSASRLSPAAATSDDRVKGGLQQQPQQHTTQASPFHQAAVATPASSSHGLTVSGEAL